VTDENLATNPNPTAPTIEGTATEVAEPTNDETEISTDALESDDQAQADVEEIEEVDWEDGKKYKIPAALKAAFLKNADYTQKTQDLAQRNSEFEAAQQGFQERVKAQQANIQEYAQLYSINARLAQFQNVNWAALNADDPVKAQALHIEMSNLDRASRQLTDHLQRKEAQALDSQRQETAKRVQEGRAALAKAIPNFTPELAKTLADHGKSYGFSAQEMGSIEDPRQIQVLHKAYLWDELQKKQRAAAAKAKSEQTPQANPVPQVAGRQKAAATLSDNLSSEEWARRRNAQIANRRRA